MADRLKRRRHAIPSTAGIEWQALESPAEILPEAWDNGEASFFEDSEVTITVDWGSNERGRLACGLTVMEPVAKTRNVDLYVLNLQSYVGVIHFSLVTDMGRQIGGHEMRVGRRKLASDEDLRELEQNWTLLNVPVDASIRQRVFGEAGIRAGAPSVPQWAHMMRALLRPLSAATRSVTSRPMRSLQSRIRPERAHGVRRPAVSPILAAVQGRQTVDSFTPQWERDPGAAGMAAQDARRILTHVQRLRADIEEAGAHLDPELDLQFRQLQAFLGRIGKTGDLRRAPRARQAVLHEPRYRLLHRASALTRRSAVPEEGDLRAFRPPTPAMYELWCARAIIEEVAPRQDWPRLLIALAQPGRSKGLAVRRGANPLWMYAQYEMSIRGWNHVPDLVLHLVTPNYVILLDVKYRGENEDLTKVPSDAIATMHRYRDVYRTTHENASHRSLWCAVLHPAPGWMDDNWRPDVPFAAALDSRTRIGAIPVSPSLRLPLRTYLETIGVSRRGRAIRQPQET